MPYWHHRGYLPHYESHSKIQAVTFRLADSLPLGVSERLLTSDRVETDVEYRKRIEQYLDAGYGSCVLKRPDVASLLQNSLLYFEAIRYELHAWVIMPNHVHVIVRMIPPFKLGNEVKAWKASVSHAPSGSGRMWQEEYWDRFIRDCAHYDQAVNYVHTNPVDAGLISSAEKWAWSSARRWKELRRISDPEAKPG